MSTDPQHPIQPFVIDKQGTKRFKENKIVRYLVDSGDMLLNRLNRMIFSMEDWQQFMQLIGTSLGGYADCPHVTNEAYARAVLVNDATRAMRFAPLDERYVLNNICDAARHIQQSVDACNECGGTGEHRLLAKGAHCPKCADQRACLKRLRFIIGDDKPASVAKHEHEWIYHPTLTDVFACRTCPTLMAVKGVPPGTKITRYIVVDQGFESDVHDTKTRAPICRCSTQADANMIAARLNDQPPAKKG